MSQKSFITGCAAVAVALWQLSSPVSARAQSNFNMRVMAANITSGNGTYQTAGINIFKGLKPDIVAIQEFKYASSTTTDIRDFVDLAFGTNFNYFRESGYNIPNGVISRWPILASGSWDDPEVADRGFAWARIDLPGTNDLYVVSVHMYNSGNETERNNEAVAIKSNIVASFPANAWVIVAGDCNTDDRDEQAITTFKTFLSDSPVPTDLVSGGDADTNEPRSKDYDYVLPSFSMTNMLTNVVIGAVSFPNGLVFDSTVFSANYGLGSVSPVTSGDSHVSGMQHMAVVKDFHIIGTGSSSPPAITSQPQSRTNLYGTDATFNVTASGASPLAYQWRLAGTNISGATTSSYTRTNVTGADAGNYTVVITNSLGSVTSSVAVLTVDSKPAITAQPQSVAVNAGANAVFNVTATGAPTLAYQWRLAGTNIPGATATSLTRSNVQASDAGSYTVVITNASGSVTSSVATLTVLSGGSSVIAQWNFNSTTPDANTTTGVTTPSIGAGTASAVGGATTSFASGDTVLDPAPAADNSAWNSATYPAVSTDNKSRGLQFAVSTVGWQNIIVYWGSRSSDTGSRYGRMQYSTNGVNFTDFTLSFSNSNSVFTRKTNSLAAVLAVNDNPGFIVRFVSEFESTATGSGTAGYVAANSPTSSYSTSGTMRYDMVTILGSPIVSGTAPNITNQPSSVVTTQGADATFTVGADGTAPLAYQWRFNGTNIGGATSASYTRSNVQPAHVGDYSVIVSNAAGFATSTDAALALNIPQPALAMPVAGVLEWTGLSNLTYTVLTTTNLASTNWSALASVSSVNGVLNYTNAPATNEQRYYRVTWP